MESKKKSKIDINTQRNCMRYNAIIPNDVVNGEGVCVSFFVQGCPHHCEGCFNPETWDFFGGYEYTTEIKWEIIKLIGANGIQRNFSILGGEPLASENLDMVKDIVSAVRTAYPHINIYLWTGYTMNELRQFENEKVNSILSKINFLIDGTFDKNFKDLNLKLRGSSNQHVWERTEEGWKVNNE